MKKILSFMLLCSCCAFALEITNADIGTYNILDRQMKPTKMLIHLGKDRDIWVMKSKINNTNHWKNSSCDKGCEYKNSTQEELQLYLTTVVGDKKDEFDIACIQNMASAFCKFPKKNTNFQFYTFIAIATDKPIPIFLKRLDANNEPDTPNEKLPSPEEIQNTKLEIINKNPELFSPEVKQAILNGKVTIGMTPHQAQLAGGSCAYQVAPDPKWSANTNPIKIIRAQTLNPDDSNITLIFNNNTQYPELGTQRFKVQFTKGKAWEIVNLN